MGIAGEILSEWAARIGRKSLFTPGAHLSAVSGVHDDFVISNQCIDLEFCNWGRIHLQGEGYGLKYQLEDNQKHLSLFYKVSFCFFRSRFPTLKNT